MGQRECVDRKKVDDLGKNVDDHGASCLGSPSEPGILAHVVARVVSRPGVESDARAGARDLLFDARTEMAQYRYSTCWKRR